MAGERRGRFLEAVVFQALREALDGQYSLYWDQKHASLKVRPDILACDLLHDTPILLIQVTWSATQADLRPVKLWRDMAELNALKRDHNARVLLVTAERTNQRCTKLQSVAHFLWDDTICLEKIAEWPAINEYFAAAQQWLGENRGDTSFTSLLLSQIKHHREREASFDRALRSLSQILRKSKESPSLSSSGGYWPSLLHFQKSRPARGELPVGGEIRTALREGFSELVIFDEDERQALYAHHYEGMPLHSVSEHAELSGIVEGPTLRGYRLRSAALRWCLDFCGGQERAEELIRLDDTPREEYLSTIRNAPHMRAALSYVGDNMTSLTRPDLLEAQLYQCFEGRLRYPVTEKAQSPTSLWLFSAIKALLTVVGRADGWLTEVCQEIGMLRSQMSGRVLPAFERCHRLPDHAVVRAVARVFARRLQALDQRAIRGAHQRALQQMTRLLMRNKLLCHGVDPLQSLLREQLANFAPRRIRLDSCVCAALQVSQPELHLNRNDLSTEGLLAGRAFVKWQSAHGLANSRHKAVELAGRASHMILEYDQSQGNNGFRPRSEIEHFVLVLDGTWFRRDLELLIASGWTAILGPKEIDRVSQFAF